MVPRRSRHRADWRRRTGSRWQEELPPDDSRRRELDAHELVSPPVIDAAPPSLSPVSKQASEGKYDVIAIQHRLGIEGEKDTAGERSMAIENLARQGSTPEDGIQTSRRLVEATELCCRLHMIHSARMLADRRWCEAFAQSAEQCVVLGPRIIVLGLGSGLPALAAARAGAEVVWFVRVTRFGDIARRLAESNGLSARITVIVCQQWDQTPSRLPPMPSGGLRREGTAVITEEIGDDPLSEGVLPLARFARLTLLRPGGRFVPGVLRIYGMLCSVRTNRACGFDLRQFNAFQSRAPARLTCNSIHGQCPVRCNCKTVPNLGRC